MNKKLIRQLGVSFICLLLGFSVSLQLKSVRFNKAHSSDNLRAAELQSQLNAEREKNESLTRDLETAKAQLTELRQDSDGSILSVINKQLDDAQKLAGLVALKGPGVSVMLQDAKKGTTDSQIIHDSDIRTVINELLASGAEAISVNGERIVSTSSIRCVGPTVIVNNTRLGAPFIINAIGEAKTLEAGLIIKGGVVDTLTPWGINVTITKSDKLEIPAYKGASNFKYSEIIETNQNGGDAR